MLSSLSFRQFFAIYIIIIGTISLGIPVIYSKDFMIFNFWAPMLLRPKAVTAVKINHY